AQGRDDRDPGRNGGIPEFPGRKGHGEVHHHQECARPQLQGLRARAAATGIASLSAGESNDPYLWIERRGSRHQVGRRPRRAGCHSRLADALAVASAANATETGGRRTEVMSTGAKMATATGAPAGIGPEVSLKAALDPAVRKACRPIVVSDL